MPGGMDVIQKKMQLRKAIEEISGLRYVADNLELASGLAKRVLLETPFMRGVGEIGAALERVAEVLAAMDSETRQDSLDLIAVKLEQVKDLRGTVAKIAAGRTLDDIEFFEVKTFAMLAGVVDGLLADAGIGVVAVPDMAGVVALLDPDRTGIPHFSIYDSYLPELAEVRRKIKKLKAKGAEEEKIAEQYDRNAELEDSVRQRLSAELMKFGEVIGEAQAAVAELDILIAKARQAKALGLCKPTVAESETVYRGVFNPAVREALRGRGKEFQPVDIALGEWPTVITGANMGGKTVLLKTVGLAQAMFQFGFYVPAAEAQIVPVDAILTSIGDTQDEMSGLSSFAAEMLRLNGIMGEVKAGKRALVLIDEPARTTNPAEGEAIVNALLDFLARQHVRALVTSHYGGIRADVRKLRVRGFAQEAEGVTVHNIQDYMDYSLTGDDGDAPREALRIARILGVDDELVGRAAEYLKGKE